MKTIHEHFMRRNRMSVPTRIRKAKRQTLDAGYTYTAPLIVKRSNATL